MASVTGDPQDPNTLFQFTPGGAWVNQQNQEIVPSVAVAAAGGSAAPPAAVNNYFTTTQPASSKQGLVILAGAGLVLFILLEVASGR